METVIGRLGKNSKMVICGDMAQIDLKDKRETGFSFLSRIEEHVEGFKTINLEYNQIYLISKEFFNKLKRRAKTLLFLWYIYKWFIHFILITKIHFLNFSGGFKYI